MADQKISLIEYNPFDGIKESTLTLLLKNINIKIANALRRISMVNIPVLGFPPNLIEIEKNTSIAFNNDYMKLRLSLLPIFNVDTKDKVEIYIDSTNSDSDIINVTTNDIKMFVDEKELNTYNKKYPILLIKLKPNESFKCHMKSRIGTGDEHALWNASRNSFYEELNDNEIKLTIQSSGRINEKKILIRACSFILTKLEKCKEELLSIDINKNEKQIKFVLPDEDHTIGEILNYEFQNHKNISFSGVSRPDYFVKNIEITVHSDNPIPSMLESLDSLYKQISNIKKLIKNIKI